MAGIGFTPVDVLVAVATIAIVAMAVHFWRRGLRGLVRLDLAAIRARHAELDRNAPRAAVNATSEKLFNPVCVSMRDITIASENGGTTVRVPFTALLSCRAVCALGEEPTAAIDALLRHQPHASALLLDRGYEAGTHVLAVELPRIAAAAAIGLMTGEADMSATIVTVMQGEQAPLLALWAVVRGQCRPLKEVFLSGSGEGASTCSVCLDSPSTEMLLPCQHLCLCSACAASVPACPICRQAPTVRLHMPA
eukprot:m.258364 g.258364  ORF g.258364 m.258364 type:complete len:251 (-) comp21473_c0_seq1:689-1441(-)